MRDKLRKEITKEQYLRATQQHDVTGIFDLRDYMYGIYNEYFYQEDNRYFVSYRLGDSCD